MGDAGHGAEGSEEVDFLFVEVGTPDHAVKGRGGALTVADEGQFFEIGLLECVVDHGWQVVAADFGETEIPKRLLPLL